MKTIYEYMERVVLNIPDEKFKKRFRLYLPSTYSHRAPTTSVHCRVHSLLNKLHVWCWEQDYWSQDYPWNTAVEKPHNVKSLAENFIHDPDFGSICIIQNHIFKWYLYKKEKEEKTLWWTIDSSKAHPTGNVSPAIMILFRFIVENRRYNITKSFIFLMIWFMLLTNNSPLREIPKSRKVKNLSKI